MSDSNSKISFSFAGCGFLGIYHIGVATCLREHAPHLLEDAKMAGASAGALIACCLICKVSLNHCVDFTLRLARSARDFPLGGWEPGVDIEGILRKSLEYILPEDAHIRCTDRLFVSVTELGFSMKNRIISEFKTREDLINVLLCSAFIPGFSSYTLPSYKDQYLVDGGLSNNLPAFDIDTITVSPWAGEHSISPRDPYGQSFPMTFYNTSFCPSGHNIVRFNDAFNPPTPETLKNYCWQGYDDAISFLSENALIHCTNHRVMTHLTHWEHRTIPSDKECADCEHHRHHAANSRLPPDIIALLTEEEGAGLFPINVTPLILAPIRKLLNIWLIPIHMIKDWVMQLYLVAYFSADKTKLAEGCMKMIKSLCNPRTLLLNLLCCTTTKVVLIAMEYCARVCSELTAIYHTLLFTKQVVCNKICRQCGLKLDESPGKLRVPPEQAQEFRKVTGAAEAAQYSVVCERGDAQDVLEVVVQSPPLAVSTNHAEVSSQEAADVAVVLDIRTQAVEVAIPLQEQISDNGKNETVHIPGVGEIEEVHIDRVNLNSQFSACQENEENMILDQSAEYKLESGLCEPRGKRLQKYVHKFEQYKSVMTLHYVDENEVLHTESLFVEDSLPDSAELAAVPSLSQNHAESPVEGVTESKDSLGCKMSNNDEAFIKEPLEFFYQDVGTELKQLLEEKVLKPQREYEKEYQKVHQKRLRQKGKKEVRKNTGHFSLEVISFSEDMPPSILSQGNSIKNDHLEDGPKLVRSVSDAISLRSSIKDLKGLFLERNDKEKKQRVVNMKEDHFTASTQSLQSLQSLPAAVLTRSLSDPSDVARHLQALEQSGLRDGRERNLQKKFRRHNSIASGY